MPPGLLQRAPVHGVCGWVVWGEWLRVAAGLLLVPGSLFTWG